MPDEIYAKIITRTEGEHQDALILVNEDYPIRSEIQ